MEGKAYAVLEALLWLIQLNFYSVFIELDCKLVADRINNEVKDISECRIILSQIKNLLRIYPTYTVSFGIVWYFSTCSS
ncbi:hypothetical protein JHK82_029019 [Glycine max]|uniref:RNase H type-1 domain-containing protein n=2 Tax=Glycine subgen. Soja TaxID=1462606 RepID=A0A0R0I541_SOYBN|nr:hypothetical protein JHK87_028932 [Glycine soja]KAG4998236.1 hypothetical protein JHK85_029675 [Glycine max]KAG5004993.1 hypothetical protein JHK86_029132 [Glycine max]KAG5128184.1 hypothetical protein JHK82_029019 [Glycine max]KAG5152787.1 hypothetical protein JHK84_029259 [Glycine max]